MRHVPRDIFRYRQPTIATMILAAMESDMIAVLLPKLDHKQRRA